MGNFRGGNRGGFGGGNKFGGGRDGGRPSFQKKSWGSSRDDGGSVSMHKAVCDECGQNCEVPFRPTQGKPIFCSNCFSAQKGNDNGDRSPRRDSRDSRGFGDRKPATNNFGSNNGNNDVTKQLELLNQKLDKLVKSIEVLLPNKPVADKKTEPVVEASKKEVKVENKAKKEKIAKDVKKVVKKITKKATKKTTKK